MFLFLLSGSEWKQMETTPLAKTISVSQGERETQPPGIQKAFANMEQSEYFIRYHPGAGNLHSPNRAQNMYITYKSDGFSLNPIVETIKWNIDFSLMGIYRGNQLILSPTETPTEKITDNHLIFAQFGYEIEYLNNKEGMRQNFIIARKPEGNEPLRVKLRVKADNLILSCTNNELIGTQGGLVQYYYKDLKVYDANHRPVEANMQLKGDELALVVYDQIATYPLTIDPISTTAAAWVQCDQVNAQLGNSVASAGDVNGDGYSDVIVGAHLYDNEGAAFVYLGSGSGISSTPAAVLQCHQVEASMGSSVSGAGDVNGDGYSDVIVGARLYNNGEDNEGAAFVYYGSPSGIITTPAIILESNQGGAEMGNSVSNAGDVNGDGYSDVIVGAYLYDVNEVGEGAAFVYYGSAAGISSTAVTRVVSNQYGARMGNSVSGAGDINGDGYSDVVVGAYLYDNGQGDEGAAFVYHGSAGGINTIAAAIIEQNQWYANLGESVSGAGDVNGDGYGDVIVGSRFFSLGQDKEGVAFVYHGTPGGIRTDWAWKYESDQDGAWLGNSVAGAGDVNDDGYDDVIIGAIRYTKGQTYEGVAFVFHGSQYGINQSLLNIIEVDQDYAGTGSSVSSAGDVNGDYFCDVIVGSQFYEYQQTNEGVAWIHHGIGTTHRTHRWYKDADNDGYSDGNTLSQSDQPIGYKLAANLTAISGDCNDANAAINPSASEICNGIDDDCDGGIDEGVLTTFYRDADGDTYGNALVTTTACSAPTGYVANSTDCDDANAAIKPGATEVCGNGIDDNCDGVIDETNLIWYIDADGDSFGSDVKFLVSCVKPAGYVDNYRDCNDADPNTFPGAAEICDGRDNDCNRLIDDRVPGMRKWYLDFDKDGRGTAATFKVACAQPAGYVENADDCNDKDNTIYPGAPELCDGKDNDCNGKKDDNAPGTRVWYRDMDGDGFGRATPTKVACSKPTGYVDNFRDCDDTKAAVNPNAAEICGNNIDDNCDGVSNPCETFGIENTEAQIVVKPLVKKEEESKALEIRLSPNPASTELLVTLDQFVPNQKLEMLLMTSEGRSLKTESLVPTVKGQQVRFDIRQISSGYYLLQVKQGALQQTKKVMIVK